MQNPQSNRAFTLIELLVGLLVTSILLSAVATMAFAMNSANTASGDTAEKQAQLRQATLRVYELIGPSRLICAAPGDDLAVWRADEDADNLIDVDELVYLERGPNRDMLLLRQFSSGGNTHKTLSDLALLATKAQLAAGYSATLVPLIPAGQDVRFVFDAAPPFTRLITVTFGLAENRVVHQYQISTALGAWAGHLVTAAGDSLVGPDDD